MAIGPYVAGPVLISLNLRDGNGLLPLGYSVDGVQVAEIPHYKDIHSDRYGGQEGPAIDRQFFGRSARIPLQLSEVEPIMLRRMRLMAFGGAGITRPGCPLMAEGRTIQAVLVGAKDADALVANPAADTITPLNYPNCYLTDPVEIPVGSKYSIFSFELVALQWNGADGVTRLYLDRSTEVIPDLAAYTPPP